jgi:2-methylcitrate dehydratase PrpD
MATPPAALAIDALAQFAATASAADCMPHLALHTADALVALRAGAATAEGQSLLRFVAGADPSPLGRVVANAAVMRLTEIDDIHRASCVTVGALTVPVAVAFATEATSPAHFFDALYVGHELALRLALAAGGARLLTRGQWPSLIVAPFGAAATAGRLLGLSPARMRHALALAVSHAPRQPGRFQGTRPGRWWMFGEAVRSGCMAALAAADGIDGDPELLSADWLKTVGGDLAAPDQLTPTGLLTRGLSIKPHASAKQALAAIHGLRQLMDQHQLVPEQIEAIEVQVPPPYAAMLDRDPPRSNRLATLVNAPWQLALMALQPALLDDVAREVWPEDPRLPALATRIRVVADPALDALYPAAFPARVVLRVGGVRHEILVSDSPGDPALAFDAAQLIDKARRMLGSGAELDSVRSVLGLPGNASAMASLRAAFGYAANEHNGQGLSIHP